MLKQLVQNPPNTCSPAYFWFFNDHVSLDDIMAQLHDMVDHGVRAILLHPMPYAFRPVTMQTRMSPDYLTPDYFRVCKAIMDEAARLGLHYWLYDEGGWPSGGACTLVSQVDPDHFRRQELRRREDGTVGPTPLGAPVPGFYPNLLNRAVTDTFLKLTHEGYYAAAPEHFGSTIQFAFQDEASFGQALAWTDDLDEVFRQRKGYDLKPYYEQLIIPPKPGDSDDLVQARIDLADVRSQLFIERWMKPVQDWCHAHGILSSGHMNGENEPSGNYNYGYGHILRALRALDVPGVDVIWRQLFPGVCTHHFPKYASSIARQHGIQTALSEEAAVYGNGLTPEQLKWLTDFQILRGLNLFVISALPMSLKDPFLYTSTRPSYGVHNPLWKYSDLWHADIARTCALMRAGTAVCDTAVFYDVRSIWAGAAIQTNAIKIHDRIAAELLARHCEFDFVDDDAVCDATLGTTADGTPCLQIGKMSYTTLVLPSVNRCEPRTRQAIQAFQKAGGRVLDEYGLKAVTPLLLIDGAPNASDIHVTKRLADGKAIYFLTNETAAPADVLLHFPETASCVRVNTITGDFLPQDREADGTVRWHFLPYSSVLFIFGETPTADAPLAVPPQARTLHLTDGWSLRPVLSYELSSNGVSTVPQTAPARPAALGDWRPALGDFFSGDARYTVHFLNDGTCAHAVLDLGDVNYACDVTLNGRPVGHLAWHPYTCDLSAALQTGVNTLEITVTNTLANALADPRWPAQWRRDFPKCLTHYDDRERAAERDSLPSGLFGPVCVRFF